MAAKSKKVIDSDPKRLRATFTQKECLECYLNGLTNYSYFSQKVTGKKM